MLEGFKLWGTSGISTRTITIHDLDSVVKSRLSKFADDTKLGGKVDSRGGGDQIQESIDTCKDWQMQFNLSKTV